MRCGGHWLITRARCRAHGTGESTLWPAVALGNEDTRQARDQTRRSSFPSDSSLTQRECRGLLTHAETDCVAGHMGFEPANPSASYLIGIA